MEDEREQSEFNLALRTLDRLNYYFWEASFKKQSHDAHGWFYALLQCFDELINDMKTAEKQQKIPYIKALADRVNALSGQRQHNPASSIPRDLFWELRELEWWLRQVAEEAGLLKKMKEDPTKAFR